MVLGKQRRQLRRAKGLLAQDAGGKLRQAHTEVIRMERAKAELKRATVKTVPEAYGIEVAEAGGSLVLPDQANEPGCRRSYRDALPNRFAVQVGRENSAARIRGDAPRAVTGLLWAKGSAHDVLT
ncbi:hypothetical protein ACWGKW_19625 [Streptomyces sp. NPDC054766]